MDEMAAQAEIVKSLGSLVAIEGDKDVISTQLRLLPPSCKIMIMGPLVDCLEQPKTDEPFQPRAFVRDVHSKLSSRVDVARSFLKDSTEDQPRLVFMNGGSVSARLACVTEISERLTGGEIKAAEDIFQEIVEDGVAGLMREEANIHEKWSGEQMEEKQNFDDVKEVQEDPSTAAMKAADSLDRDTAELQISCEDEVDYMDIQTTSHLNLETSAEIPGTPQIGKTIFTDPNGQVIRTTLVTIPSQLTSTDHKRDTFGGLNPNSEGSNYTDAMPYQDEMDYGTNLLSPRSRAGSEPATPGLVEIGEACVVDIGTKPIRRVKSVDRFQERRPGSAASDHSPRPLRPAASAQDLTRLGGEPYEVSSYSRSIETLPRTTFVRASKTFIRRSPPVSRQPSVEPVGVVDGGEIAQKHQSQMIDAGTQSADDTEREQQFEPVFPIVEDLIIYFAEDTQNELREAIIRSYKNGSYPEVPSLSDSASTVSTLPSPSHSYKRHPLRPQSNITAESDDDDYHRRQEFDPYNSNNYSQTSRSTWQLQQPSKRAHISSQVASPPTPASTPPPILSGSAQKFQEFTPLNATTPIAMQNSLRSLLNMHFPSEGKNYRQNMYPEESNRLWVPVFRNDQGLDGRTVDQIIAIGCEDGVKKEFYNDVVGQVANIGTKKSGLSRTGRLDIKYLITTAMQTYTAIAAQNLAAQTNENPYTHPALLASLVAPHLETYLSANDSTRLLVLTYPASHLSTIFELRKLFGSKLLKIAGIIDSSSSDPSNSTSSTKPKSSTKAKHTTPPNPLSNEGVASFHNRLRSGSTRSLPSSSPPMPRSPQEETQSISTSSSQNSLRKPVVSFSKANYLLPSTATATEISTFLTSITTSLVSISSFYIPEPEPEPEVQILVQSASLEHLAPPPIPQRASTPKMAAQTRPKSPKTPTSTHRKFFGGGHKTTKSTNSSKLRVDDKSWENFYITGEDSDQDDVSRKLMPRLVEKELRRGNSRKALKLLGLS